MRTTVGLVLAVSALAGCGRRQLDLRSELRSAASLAADGAMLAEHAGAGRATEAYRSGHAGYLRDEVDRIGDRLEDAAVEPGLRREAGSLGEGVARSRAELTTIERSAERAPLERAAGRLRAIAAEMRRIAGPP